MLKKFFMLVVYLFAAIGLFFTAGYFLVRFGFTNESGIIDVQRESFLGAVLIPDSGPAVTDWQKSEEWAVLEEALRRDADVLNQAARDSGVSARLIAASLVAEQLRLFFTEREAYKQFFYPLKILGPQSQFSWGVMGMKEETAIAVETHLKDRSSPYYLGMWYEHALDLPATTTDEKSARYYRMIDQHDHYWSYLYAGLFMNQVMTQWERAGFPINDQVGVISTLYNIGFARSQPKAEPQVGGAAIQIGTKTYSFGGLAEDFYESDVLIDVFPH